jgi:hypothetical protein
VFGDGVVLAGLVFSAVVSLGSMEIFKTHEWLKAKPTVYFKCKEENKTVLPDVKEAHVLYNFKGEESWQVSWNAFLGFQLLLLLIMNDVFLLLYFFYWSRN